MKNKASLLLMEQLVMILGFALAAAVCLRGFAYASQVSREICQQEEAVYLAQSTAEQLKASRELPERTFYNEDLMPVREDESWCYCVQVTLLPSDLPGLGQAQIHVGSADTSQLFSLTVGWQEAV